MPDRADYPETLKQLAAIWAEGYVAACERYGIELGTYGDKIPPNPYGPEPSSNNPEENPS